MVCRVLYGFCFASLLAVLFRVEGSVRFFGVL